MPECASPRDRQSFQRVHPLPRCQDPCPCVHRHVCKGKEGVAGLDVGLGVGRMLSNLHLHLHLQLNDGVDASRFVMHIVMGPWTLA